jgi:hypothetical protein
MVFFSTKIKGEFKQKSKRMKRWLTRNQLTGPPKNSPEKVHGEPGLLSGSVG